jgi:hypothetical protein
MDPEKMPWVWATAQVKPGVSVVQAQSELSGIAANLSRAYPDRNRHRGVLVTQIQEATRGRLGSFVYPLFGAVGFILLIACTNVATLLLARATARRREISVRAALGAGRHRLMREFLADGLVLALPGTILGIAVAYGGIALFRTVTPENFLPRTALVELNSVVLWFTAAVGAFAGILSAVFPALTGSRVDLSDSLKGEAAARQDVPDRGSGPRWWPVRSLSHSFCLWVPDSSSTACSDSKATSSDSPRRRLRLQNCISAVRAT